MRRREWNLLVNWGLLLAGLGTFGTGIVLLLCLHVGPGAFAASAFGVGKLVWLNVHRLSAFLAAAGVMAHVGLHWSAFRGRCRHLAARSARRAVDSELILYAAFLVATVTGFVAWWGLAGSSPLFGPAVIGPAGSARHPWIDAHHVSSLVSLALAAHHVGHRWRFLVRRAKPAARVCGDADNKTA